MKVYILSGESYPNGMAATNRIKCYARALHDGGMACEVVLFQRTELPGHEKNLEWKGIEGGVPFRYTGKSTLRHKIKYLRPIYDVIDRVRAMLYIKRNIKKGDVLFLFMGGHVKQMLRYMKIAKKKGAYCVRDLCELPYGTGAETERAIRLRKVTIEQQFPKLDGIISISDALLNLARSYTPSSCVNIKVPIMVEFEHYGVETKPNTPSTPYIFHAGTLYQQKDGILGMIEAFGIAKQILNRPIKYILTGSVNACSHPEELKQIINKYKLEGSLEFVGYLDRNQVKEYLKYASLVISNRPKSKQDYYGFSTKVGEYLASGTPLLLTDWGEAVNWLEDKKSAFITEPENTDALARAIVYVFDHPDESRQVGLAGQKVCCECFDYKKWSKPLVEFMNHLGK